MADKKREDGGEGGEGMDIWDTVLEHWPLIAVGGAALAGRAVGRRGARKTIDEVASGKRKLNPRTDADEIKAFGTQRGREKYVRDSGRGAALGFGVLPSGMATGYYMAKDASARKHRK